MNKPYGALALACLLALSGCVSVEDYEKKVSEASGLRKDLDISRTRIASLRRSTDDLRKQIGDGRLENEELAQSLTMSRRHGQKLESSLADTRTRLSFQSQEGKSAQKESARLKNAIEKSRDRERTLEKSLAGIRQKLDRFEDRLRLQEQLKKDMAAQFSKESSSGTVSISRRKENVVISLASTILFSSGSARIRASGKNHLKKISRIFNRYLNREIQVQGHTDNIPISDRLTERWESNWELSAARATRILRFLVEIGNIDPRRISAAGMGEFRPIADNSTKPGRNKNRRIDIVLSPPSS
ncbi:MAG: OmpA family protein [Nitrospinota bacterium]|jgi:chemotaxis protein MotB|nr:OmpA family protein [Nitrospinota bacterium]MDP7168657.1 OmpA family protein [Nitrospinota bacterium]MDP7371279.1 OmpA family protein [Nitrospinota bacterium]MDP7663767.1 OmpA family protein [Nitrospinota bacterium]|tara:strand:+ start:1043 stop:1942 length:900 start_codon:yes stop_codon:yes gene_type:complete